VDPDYPTRDDKSKGPFVHYIGRDFASSGMSGPDFTVLLNRSSPILDYKYPVVPKDAKPHRCVISFRNLCLWLIARQCRLIVALFQQDKPNINAPKGFNPTAREKFNVTEFGKNVGGLNLVSASVFFVGPPADPALNGTGAIVDTVGDASKSNATPLYSIAPTAASICATVALAAFIMY
jgi:hypothetical protein